ncbi:MAG: hypothetical protein ACOC1F_00185 [Myxococcota bacterium]
MKTSLLLLGCVSLMFCGCGGDDDDENVNLERCESIENQIRAVAERDDDLKDYEGVDRTANPCADPVPTTAYTDYGPACKELEGCPEDLK